jgi:hypothetical protein
VRPEATPEQRKVAKLAAGTLLIHRSRTSKVIRAVVAGAVVEASTQVALHFGEPTTTGVLAAVMVASKGLAVKLAATILLARQAARAAATNRLTRELASAGVTVSSGDLGHASSRHHEDVGHSDVAAEALAVAWRSLAAAAALGALRKETDPAKAIRATLGPMKARADRTALTEVSTAYNDEHRAGIEDGIAHHPRFREAVAAARVMRRWDCSLERTCSACLSHEGELAPVGDSFSGGDEPGSMHPRCACSDTLVSVGDADFYEAA